MKLHEIHTDSFTYDLIQMYLAKGEEMWLDLPGDQGSMPLNQKILDCRLSLSGKAIYFDLEVGPHDHPDDNVYDTAFSTFDNRFTIVKEDGHLIVKGTR